MLIRYSDSVISSAYQFGGAMCIFMDGRASTHQGRGDRNTLFESCNRHNSSVFPKTQEFSSVSSSYNPMEKSSSENSNGLPGHALYGAAWSFGLMEYFRQSHSTSGIQTLI